MIPRILIRTVPAETTDEVELFWARAVDLHPDWAAITLRDPIPGTYTRSLALRDRCSSGAQFAGLVRLEALMLHGGIYLDSDFEVYQPFDPLVPLEGFAGYEDPGVIPDAVLGFEQGHPALTEVWDYAVDHLDQGAWESGPGATTAVLPSWPGILLLPPGSLYPYHWTERSRRHDDHASTNPWAFGAHHWHASWQEHVGT